MAAARKAGETSRRWRLPNSQANPRGILAKVCGPSGGELGYFTKEQMVAPFAEAAFSMDPGNYSEVPVETQFGWHVILVEDRRMTAPPSLDDLRPQLEGELADQYVQEIVENLREGAEIVVFGPNGEVTEN